MANQESKQPVYKDHLTAWRPDYPMVWNTSCKTEIGIIIDDLAYQPRTINPLFNVNLRAFTVSRDAIAKCIGQC